MIDTKSGKTFHHIARDILETWDKDDLIEDAINHMSEEELQKFCEINKLNVD